MMSIDKPLIEKAWEERATLRPGEHPEVTRVVQEVLSALDKGHLRVAEQQGPGQWVTHEWVKKAILLSFRLFENQVVKEGLRGYDKVNLKYHHWEQAQFEQAQFRAVPGAIVRYSAHIEANVVLMPSFVNVGAYVGEGTMVDTWSTIGSCAQIGRHCHISGGVGIGGVLEPLQANPVIIEDHCFIGARSEVAEGVIVEEGAVLAMGTFIGASTRIVNRATGEITYGRVPAYSVVVPGALPSITQPGGPQLSCAVIVKQVDEKTRSKTSVNELLRL